MRRLRIVWQLCTFAFALVACSAVQSPVGSTSIPPTATAPPAATATAIPTVEATPQDAETLTVWLPDVLMNAATTDETIDLLSQQIAAYASESEDLTIEIRRKQIREAGGIMPTLRTARTVAPGVLPDLTLIRREDLLTAVNEDLVQPMEGVVSTAIIGDLFSTALDVGQVDGTLYALPYALELQHVVYAPDLDPTDPTLSAYLEGEVPFLFPAARASGLNNLFFTQYVAAAPGTVSTSTLEIDEEALLALYQYYEDAVENGSIESNVIDYTRPADYRSFLSSGDFGSAVVSSQLYLELADEGVSLDVASVPTLGGTPATTLDGWMWVMTTANPNRQALVGGFLEWMLDADRQGEYVRSLDLLPSQRTALRRWYDEDYADFLVEIMPNATLPYSTVVVSAPARAVQTGLLTVLTGDRTAAEATQDVISQLAG